MDTLANECDAIAASVRADKEVYTPEFGLCVFFEVLSSLNSVAIAQCATHSEEGEGRRPEGTRAKRRFPVWGSGFFLYRIIWVLYPYIQRGGFQR